uniref:Retrotransposon Gag domain, retroviral aspartyl protease n=1 Tax=Tanacetum cinerariifolium TaxID=118510 RepID=A0A6L2KB62_TANCI|nr:retrotransposon Gag domain, retroviral aspartyl protease [Tanacetum cinerariifolium]
MVTTRNTTSNNEQPNHNDTSSPSQNPENLRQQLSSTASKLNALDALVADLVDREVEANENEYEEGINQQDMTEISFHAILSKTSGTTMKVEGTLEGIKVLTLVDSGSTHNFISASLVKQLGLKVSRVPSFGVQIGNGQVIQCNQICRGLSLVLPGLKITEDYFPFSIGGADLVLGIKWLASLNTV